MSYYDRGLAQLNSSRRFEMLQAASTSIWNRQHFLRRKEDRESEVDTSSELEVSSEKEVSADQHRVNDIENNDRKQNILEADLKMFHPSPEREPSRDSSLGYKRDYANIMKRQISSSSEASSGFHDAPDLCVCEVLAENVRNTTKKKSSFVCETCLVEVTSKKSLLQHIRGKSHIRKNIFSKEHIQGVTNTQHKNSSRKTINEISELQEICSKLETDNASLRYEIHLLHDLRLHTTSDQNEGILSFGVLNHSFAYNPSFPKISTPQKKM